MKPGMIGFAVASLAMVSQQLPAQPSLNVGTAPGYPGGTVSLPISLSRATNMTAVQFDLAFAPSRVTAGDFSFRGVLSNYVVRWRELAPGVRRVLAYSVVNAAATVTNQSRLAELPFTVSRTEYVGSGPITLNNAVVAKPDATAVSPLKLNSGAIFVRPVNLREDGKADFFLPSASDTRYLIQATTHFVYWENILTNLAFGSFMQLVDEDAPHYPYRFYRSALFDAIVGGHVGSFNRAQDGSVTFRITGLEGRTYIIQASTNLVHWQNINTNTAVRGLINFTDRGTANFRQRFFRLKSEP